MERASQNARTHRKSERTNERTNAERTNVRTHEHTNRNARTHDHTTIRTHERPHHRHFRSRLRATLAQREGQAGSLEETCGCQNVLIGVDRLSVVTRKRLGEEVLVIDNGYGCRTTVGRRDRQVGLSLGCVDYATLGRSEGRREANRRTARPGRLVVRARSRASVGAFHFQRSSMNHFYFHGCEARRDSDPACLSVGRLAACG